MGHEWIKDTLNASNDLDVSISFGMNYRIQHSLENGPYVACTTPPGLAVLANCSGPIGSFQIEFSRPLLFPVLVHLLSESDLLFPQSHLADF
jgi:hypothetical protein